jgi:hypothetical protein
MTIAAYVKNLLFCRDRRALGLSLAGLRQLLAGMPSTLHTESAGQGGRSVSRDGTPPVLTVAITRPVAGCHGLKGRP